MIERVVRFLTEDHCEFASLEEAKKHEDLLAKIKSIMSKLPKLEISGHNFYQHVPADVLTVQSQIAKLAFKTLKHEGYERHYDAVINADKPMGAYSMLGRFLDDSSSPLSRAWNRILRIDEKYREWEQPYYTHHTPADAKAIKK